MAIAVVMVALMIPTGFAVTATAAGTSAGVGDITADVPAAVTESTADFVYIVDGVGGEKDTTTKVPGTQPIQKGTYASVHEAILVAASISDRDSSSTRNNYTHFIKITADIDEPQWTKDTFRADITIDGSSCSTMPKITVGAEESHASAWLIVGNANYEANFTFRNVILDVSAASHYSTGAASCAFSLRNAGSTVTLENCVVVNNPSAYVFQGGYEGTMKLVNTKIVSSVAGDGTTAPAKSVLFILSAPAKLYLEGCELITSAASLINISAAAKVAIIDSTLTTTNTGNNTAYVISSSGNGAAVTILNSTLKCNGTTHAQSACINNTGTMSLDIHGDKTLLETTAGVATIYATANLTANIYGGRFIGNGKECAAIRVKDNCTVNIYGGYFESDASDSVTLNNQYNAQPTSPSSETATSIINVYGGTARNLGGSGSFVIRPFKGARANIYGGTFIAAGGSAIGGGETGSTGFVYVYGGTFIKTSASGTPLLHNNYKEDSKVQKYYYLYGGTYYTACNTDGTTNTYKTPWNAYRLTETKTAEGVEYAPIYNSAAGVTYSEEYTPLASATEAGNSGISAIWKDVCTITSSQTYAPVDEKPILSEYTEAITEENADFVFEVNGEETDGANGKFRTLKSVVNYLETSKADQSKKYFVKVLCSTEETFDELSEAVGTGGSVNWNITFDGSYCEDAVTPVVKLGNAATQSSYMFVNKTVTFKNLIIDGSDTKQGNSNDKAANMFVVRGGTLTFEDCTIIHPDNGMAVFAGRDDERGTYVFVGTKIVSSFVSDTATIAIMNLTTKEGTTECERSIYVEDSQLVTSAANAIYLGSGTNKPCVLTVYSGDFGASGAVIAMDTNSAVTIYDGNFTGGDSCVNCNTDSTLDIYGGTFEAKNNNSQTIVVTDGIRTDEGKINTSTTGVARTDNKHRTGTYSTARIYGGKFINSAASGSFVIRPYAGGVAYIYGGTFVSTNCTVFGTGESSSSGYLYVYGGNFISSSSTTTNGIMWDNNNATDAYKYYYLYGGNYYAASNAQAYRNSSSYHTANTMYNRMHDYVTYNDLDVKGKAATIEGYTATWADACTITLNKDGAVYGGDVFGKAYMQTNADAASESAALRVLFEVDAKADYDQIIFWVSRTDANALPLADASGEYVAGVNKVSDTEDTPVKTIYGKVKVEGADFRSAADGYGFAILEIDGISAADFATTLYVRAVAVNTTTGARCYSSLATADVNTALAGN